MPIKNPKELFVLLLTNVRNGVQRPTSIYQEMTQLVQDPEIKEAIDARIFLSDKTLSTLASAVGVVLDRGPERARNFARALMTKQLNLVEVIANA